MFFVPNCHTENAKVSKMYWMRNAKAHVPRSFDINIGKGSSVHCLMLTSYNQLDVSAFIWLVNIVISISASR
jgi:hypothetical protein